MKKRLSKKGHLVVPLFILIVLSGRLNACVNYLFSPMISVVSSFYGDKIITAQKFNKVSQVKSFSVLGRGETALILLSVHAIKSVISNEDPNFEKRAFITLSVSGAFSLSLKYLFHRTRPNTGKNVFYGPLLSKENLSFPSGHTQIAFTMAGVFTEKYGMPFLFYGVAGLVGVSRIAKKMHYLSDVVMGGFTGYIISKLCFGKMPLVRIFISSRNNKEIGIMYLPVK